MRPSAFILFDSHARVLWISHTLRDDRSMDDIVSRRIPELIDDSEGAMDAFFDCMRSESPTACLVKLTDAELQMVRFDTQPIATQQFAVKLKFLPAPPSLLPIRVLGMARLTSLSGIRLSPRELETLPLLADDLSPKEVARAMNISHTTALMHISNARCKIGVKGLGGLIRFALEEGIHGYDLEEGPDGG